MNTRSVETIWAPSIKSYTQKEWDAVRQTIHTNYRTQDRTLNQVLEILRREHDFRVSAQMLKKQIRRWKFDKKNKWHEMIAALHIEAQRDREGKPTAFLIRDVLITREEITRYFMRKGIKDLESLIRQTEGDLHDSSTVVVVTPRSSTDQTVNQSLNSTTDDRVQHGEPASRQDLPDPYRSLDPISNRDTLKIPALLPMTTESRRLVQTLNFGHQYQMELLKAPAVVIDPGSLPNGTMVETFYNNFYDGFTFQESGDSKKANECFEWAIQSIEILVRNFETPFLFYLYDLIVRFQDIDKGARLLHCLQQIGITCILHGYPITYPLVGLTGHLALLSGDARADTVERALRCAYDTIQTTSDLNDAGDHVVLQELALLLLERQKYCEASARFQQLCRWRDSICGKNSYEACRALHGLAESYYKQVTRDLNHVVSPKDPYFCLASDLLEEMHNRLDHVADVAKQKQLEVTYLRLKFWIAREMPDTSQTAYTILLDAEDRAIKAFGPESAIAARVALDIKTYLRSNGLLYRPPIGHEEWKVRGPRSTFGRFWHK